MAGSTGIGSSVAGADGLDFRDVKAFDPTNAYLLSIGEGEKSRIYKTADGGATWKLQYLNHDPRGFYDAIAFWDSQHGIALGDPIDGHFSVLITNDAGEHWERQLGPVANTQEGAFAASGTCLLARGQNDVWVVTGDLQGARVLHSVDRGRTWVASQTPVQHDGKSAGIFSIAFADDQRGVVVGGDYTHPVNDAAQRCANKRWWTDLDRAEGRAPTRLSFRGDLRGRRKRLGRRWYIRHGCFARQRAELAGAKRGRLQFSSSCRRKSVCRWR